MFIFFTESGIYALYIVTNNAMIIVLNSARKTVDKVCIVDADDDMLQTLLQFVDTQHETVLEVAHAAVRHDPVPIEFDIIVYLKKTVK